MGGIVGRLFREFAVTLSIAILISLVVSLTTTPMMCARLLRPAAERSAGRVGAWVERGFRAMHDAYRRSLAWGLAHGVVVMLVLLVTVCLNVYLYVDHPEGLLPAAGHRAPDRRHPGRPEHLVPGDAAEARRFHGDRRRRSGGRERRRLHRRRAAQFGLHVRRAEAGRRAQGNGGPGHRAAARQAREGARRQSLPAAGAGHPDRRPAEQRAIPVHAAGRRPRRAARVGAEDPAGAERAARARRRQHRPAGQGAADLARDRPRRRVAARRHAADDRHDAERRLRPAPGVDDLRAAQPVPRGDGGLARVLAVAGSAAIGLRQHVRPARRCRCRRSPRSARPTRRSASTTRASSSRRRSRSISRSACRCRRRRAPSTTRSRASACRRPCAAPSRAARGCSRRRSRASRG